MSLHCPDCRADVGLEALLDLCRRSLPHHKWASFHCPKCNGDSWVAFHRGRVAIGEIEGRPGPTFVELSSDDRAGLTVEATSEGLRLSYGDRVETIPL